MANITNIIPFDNNSLNGKGKAQNAEPGKFDSLLSTAGTKSGTVSFINDFMSSITGSLGGDIGSIFFPDASKNIFPFSPDFQSTFGISGPLPAFINAMTKKLNLTAAQNQAFQDIAVRNKDITNTPDNVQKIAQELKQAGIPS